MCAVVHSHADAGGIRDGRSCQAQDALDEGRFADASRTNDRDVVTVHGGRLRRLRVVRRPVSRVLSENAVGRPFNMIGAVAQQEGSSRVSGNLPNDETILSLEIRDAEGPDCGSIPKHCHHALGLSERARRSRSPLLSLSRCRNRPSRIEKGAAQELERRRRRRGQSVGRRGRQRWI